MSGNFDPFSRPHTILSTVTLRTLLLIFAVASSQIGCYSVRYQTRTTEAGKRHEIPAHFFFWGLAGEKDVDLDAVCPEGPVRWSNHASAADVLLTLVTLGLYSPRTIVVECARTP